jgi:hypothetical protein
MGDWRPLSNAEVDFIKNLQNTHIRNQIITNPSKKDIRIIRNLFGNVCKGNLKFTEPQREKLIPYAKIIRRLGDPKKQCNKKILLQSGEAISVLAPLFTALISAISKKVLKKIIPV